MADNASGGITLEAGKIISAIDILKPDVRQTLFRRYGNQGINFFTLLEGMGYSRPVTQKVTKTYEEDWIHQDIHLGSTITNTGTNTYTFTLSTTSGIRDYIEQNVTSPYSSANQYIFPVQKYDIITARDNNAKLWVSNVSISGSTCTVSVTHMNPTVGPFPYTSYVAGDTFIVTGNAYGEGSDQTGGMVRKPIVDNHYTQIIKSTYRWTGSQMVSQPWFTELSDGTGLPAYYIYGQESLDYEHMLSIDAALLFGALTEISITDSATEGPEPIQTTEGLDPYIKRTGTTISYTPGTLSVPLFDYMDKILDQEGAPSYLCGLLGIDLDNEKDNVLKGYFQNNMQDYMRDRLTADVFGGNPGMAMEVNFRYWQKGYRQWNFARMGSFNMKKLYGATGFKTPQLGLFFPMGSKLDQKDRSKRVPYMGVIYRELNGYSRKSEAFLLRGAGPGQKITSADLNKLCMRSDMGAEHCGGNQMLRVVAA